MTMTLIHGIWWPSDVGERWRHSIRHVDSIEWAIKRCRLKRTVVQAGGNIGLWPKRLAQSFRRVLSFEPEPISRACLVKNVPPQVEVRAEALGDQAGVCDVQRSSLGSHFVMSGRTVPIVTVDSLELADLDLLQLDIEGYEWHALMGAAETVRRCHPLIQVEIRGFTEKYDKSDADVCGLLTTFGYQPVSHQPGNDVVWEWAEA